MLTSDELGFSLNVSEPAEMYYDTNSINRNKMQNDALTQLNKSSPSATRLVATNIISKSKILQ